MACSSLSALAASGRAHRNDLMRLHSKDNANEFAQILAETVLSSQVRMQTCALGSVFILSSIKKSRCWIVLDDGATTVNTHR